MKKLFIALICCNGFIVSAPIGDYEREKYILQPAYQFAPDDLSNEQHLQEMRGYPYPESYDSSDPLKSYGPSAKDITDRFKREKTELLK
jgi:hypothetical protein